MTLQELNLYYIDTEIIPLQIDDKTIAVKQYLPAKLKIELINKVLKAARENGKNYFNLYLLGVIFDLYLVDYYTDIDFSDEDMLNSFEVYDSLECNGFFDKFFSVMNEKEYNKLRETLESCVEKEETLSVQVSDSIKQITQAIPALSEQLVDVVNNFDPEDLSQIINLAKATGMDNAPPQING